jgi:predicted transposase/invertase (TIGR01784 family)
MANPHDALFKRVFSQPSEAAAVLRHVLPQELVALIDWSTLSLEPGSFVDHALRDQHADLLYSVKLAGRRVFIYVLLEHKSGDDAWTALQLHVYTLRIWEGYRAAHPEAKKLPPILAIVVAHGATTWRGPQDLLELIDVDGELRDVLAPYLPRHRFLLDDLAAVGEAGLRRRTASSLARLALFSLLRARQSDDILGELRRWVDVVRAMLRAPGGINALAPSSGISGASAESAETRCASS